jgi:hypothetical protein
MRTELIKIMLVGLSLGLAQAQEGATAVGAALSVKGLEVISLRTALGGNPYLHLGVQAGKDQGAWTAGLSLTQFLIFSPCRGACRRSAPVAPYVDFGVRMSYLPETTTTTPYGHAGAGVLVPLGFLEAFVQGNLYTAISPVRPNFDLIGGLRIRF